jgi:hypothetical protein
MGDYNTLDTNEIKRLMHMVVRSFVTEEDGNRVTMNNMAGLLAKLHGIVDGEITIKEERNAGEPPSTEGK